ncbi:MAG: lysophospholipid acyltransferase family protein [Tenuifilaceae bacterium]|jgi:KDO2-lipid IV(A) lauroyltransferase|nr:lysophospholipid acyltransferase family protein [Tenuifilaceae bacterium]
MRKILFGLFYGFTWLIAQIPAKASFILSDFIYLVIYHIAGYRRKVVRKNLTNSFPSKDLDAIIRIEKAYYHHLCDLFLENFFLLHASRQRAVKRCKFKNPEVFEKLYAEGKSAILVSGHYGNWELFALIGKVAKHTSLGVYKPLSNKNFEVMMNRTRKRFGGIPVPMMDTLRAIVDCNRKGQPFLLGLVGDQTPPAKHIQYWTMFLNQDTPVYLGIEKIAQKFDLPVYFCDMQKIRRGYYEVNFELITDNPKSLGEFELTELHTHRLEKQIMDRPEFWLWSHRRWKHKPKKNTQSQ